MLSSSMNTARTTAVRAAKHVQQSRGITNRVILTSPPKEQGFFESLLNKTSMPAVPLDHNFPGAATPTEVAVQNYATETTTLANGVRVVSCDSAAPVASVGAYVDAGSRCENMEASGVSKFMEHFAYKSTSNRSEFKTFRDNQAAGTQVFCTASRDHTAYTAECLRENVGATVNTLADAIQNASFDFDELHEALPHYKEQVALKLADPWAQLDETVHAAAYNGNTLGLPLYSSAPTVFNKELLDVYVKTFHTSKRVVVSGVGVAHADLVSMATKEFKNLPADSGVANAKAQYTGGDLRVKKSSPLTYVSLGFETASWASKDYVSLLVLESMMGGGASVSTGGPGKGVHSRLQQNLLSNDFVQAAQAGASTHSDSSLFVLSASTTANQAEQLVDALSGEMHGMAGKVSAEELARAKTQLKSTVSMQQESRQHVLDTLARDTLSGAAVTSAQIDAVSEADIQRVASAMFKTPLSMAVYGNLSYAPRYDTVANRFA